MCAHVFRISSQFLQSCFTGADLRADTGVERGIMVSHEAVNAPMALAASPRDAPDTCIMRSIIVAMLH